MFTKEKDPALVLVQIAREVESGNYPANRAFVEVIQQAGFVSLWFFLRYVLSYSGPYHLLNDGLHMDMCNFRQSALSMSDGARSAIIVPRGFYKSSIAGHGVDTWELLRNPNMRILLASSVAEKARGWCNIARKNFDSNAFFAFLYPEYVPGPRAARWNENEFVLPNRTRAYVEPSMSSCGATGASEGVHVDLLNLDDLEGLEDLDNTQRSSAGMFAKKKWFNTNTTALLVDRTSRIHLNGTLFGSDDIHAGILADAHTIAGFQNGEFSENAAGHWAVYYRCWEEDNVEVFPEVMDREKYADLLRKDPWSAITQYANRARDPELVEFSSFEPARRRLQYSKKREMFYVLPSDNALASNWDDDDNLQALPLSALDIVMAVDPAGTEKGISARTSRSAIVIVGMDSEENAYLLWCRAGYFNVFRLFDLIFEGNAKFAGHIRGTFVEANAMQKIIAPLLNRERERRGVYINAQPVMATGDKEARIRMNVGRALTQDRVVLIEGEETAFEEERLVFPGNEYRRDVLDAFEKALCALRKPESEAENAEDVEIEEEYTYEPTRNQWTGM